MDKAHLTTVDENPLLAGLRLTRTPEPAIMVIFGASGDLTQRKLMPALYNLTREGLLPAQFAVVGVARTEMDDAAFRDKMHAAVVEHSRSGDPTPVVWESFANRLFYLPLRAYDDTPSYEALSARLAELDVRFGTGGNRLFYLSTPPSVAGEIIDGLDHAGLADPSDGWRRIIVEKPFGYDIDSSRELNGHLLRVFSEDEVFRIDHYLGKETVQNLLVLRFANTIFEPIWDRRYVDQIQITVAEQVGVEGRGGYYDEAGALRDIIQNHGLQLLSLTAMEPPIAFDARQVRDEKLKVLLSVQTPGPVEAARQTVRGQYTAGIIGGEPAPGYREEHGVRPDSTTETYVAMRLELDTWRWAGVPFYLRTGKRLPKRATEIAIEFRSPPLILFPTTSLGSVRPNLLVINIQPDEGVSIRFEAKVPGQAMWMRPVYMDFRYGATFAEQQPEAYERLILDALLGDATLFTRADEVEAQWNIIQPILDGWQHAPAPEGYPSGSWGPAGADAFIEASGRRWRRL